MKAGEEGNPVYTVLYILSSGRDVIGTFTFAHCLRKLGFGGRQPDKVHFATVHQGYRGKLGEQEVSLRLTSSHHRKDRKAGNQSYYYLTPSLRPSRSQALDKCPLTRQNAVAAHT